MGSISAATAVCAALTGLALLLLLRPPQHALRRTAVRSPARSPTRLRVGRVLGGRPDARPLGRRLLLGGVAGAAVCLAAASVDGGPGWLAWAGLPLLTLATAILLGWTEPAANRRRQQVLVLQAPQALELLAACLGAGLPVRTACAAVTAAFDGPVAEELGRVLAATALGVSDADAWRTLSDHPQFGGAAGDLARSVESGTRLVEGLRQHAEVARERRRAALQIRARAVGVRSVMPLMICFIPSFLLLGVVPTIVSALMNALPAGL